MRKHFLALVLVVSLIGSSFALVENFNGVHAEGMCPAGMSDIDCLAYLRNQVNDNSKTQNDLNKRISEEQYGRLTYQQRSQYLASQIDQAQKNITILINQIELGKVESRILSKDITTTQNNIDTVAQEIQKLNNSIKKRISFSYKYSFVSPVELFLETKNFDTLLRKTKYISETHKKDKEILEEMNKKEHILKNEQEVLAKKKNELETKQTELEARQKDLNQEQEYHAQQKLEQDRLIADSRRREAEYQANLVAMKNAQNAINAQISEIIRKNLKEGVIPVNTPVKKGQIIAFQGHTGCSMGSHLHFELTIDDKNVNPFGSGYFTGGAVQGKIGSGMAQSPMAGAVLTQGPHQWNALDMVSTADGNQSGDWYEVKQGFTCYGVRVPAGWYPLRGEGAGVVAVMDGMVSAVLTDAAGGKYAVVKHGNGDYSLYLHLR